MYLGRRYEAEQAEAAFEIAAAADAAKQPAVAPEAAPVTRRSQSEDLRVTSDKFTSTRNTDDSISGSIHSLDWAPPTRPLSHDGPRLAGLNVPRPTIPCGSRGPTSEQGSPIKYHVDRRGDSSGSARMPWPAGSPHKGHSKMDADVGTPQHLSTMLSRQAKLEALDSCVMRMFGRRATFDATTATEVYLQQLTGVMTTPDPRDIEACEGMLEVYFMQLDNLLSRLLVATSKVADTEDLISIDLDHRRNELVALNLVVNSIMVVFAVISAVTGAFGMNLNAWMPTSKSEAKTAFLITVLMSVSGGAGLFFGILAYARNHRLLFIANGPAG